MAEKCFALVRGRTIRVTKLDGCGRPVPHPYAQVVSDGYITVTLTANTDEGNTINIKNAAGKTCILDEPCPEFLGYGVEIALCGVDPELNTVLTGNELVEDFSATPLNVGFRQNTKVDRCKFGFALEMWTGVANADCDDDDDPSFGYMLVPYIKGGIIGDLTVADDAINFTLTGAKSKDGTNWGVGPYNVVKDATGNAVPLKTALDANDHLHMQLTEVPPPPAVCGATALGTLATGADAGYPGDYTPANSYGPDNFAALTATPLAANPATAWTLGQHIELLDGTQAHWDGAAWVAGVAPNA